MRVFSFGGGVQSVAVLVLAAQGRLQYDAFLFANVGEDSENPDTLDYLEQYARPYAEVHDIEIVELRKVMLRGERKGDVETVYGRSVGDNKSVPIPAYLSSGMPSNRACTTNFKVEVLARWIKQHGATKEEPATVGLGISIDEIHRANSRNTIAWQKLEYPLIDMGMSRKDCKTIIVDAGLPTPPKSACFFCPFMKHDEWLELKRTKPELFEKAVALEKRLNEKRDATGRDIVRLHRSLAPLEDAVGLQYSLFEDDACESGYCMV